MSQVESSFGTGGGKGGEEVVEDEEKAPSEKSEHVDIDMGAMNMFGGGDSSSDDDDDDSDDSDEW